MPGPEPPSKKTPSSFDAFNNVDKLVSKPILGSDGAASWQDFRKDNKKAFSKTSNAPLAPLKKSDKLGSGMSSWKEEREREQEARKAEGAAALGDGYTVFRKKDGKEEAMANKDRKRIEQRIRPENKEYYLMAKTFEGWKWDYVFTTRDHRVGYFWDGWDSLKRLKGELPAKARPSSATTTTEKESLAGTGKRSQDASHITSDESGDNVKQAMKKKKRKKNAPPVIIEDPNNPLEQVQAAIRKRNERLGLVTSNSDLPPGWEMAPDPSTGKSYYFHRASGERSWEKPKTPDNDLPDGWDVASDPSGKQYYYHTSGETRWEKPAA